MGSNTLAMEAIWTTSRRRSNKLVHITNGNICCSKPSCSDLAMSGSSLCWYHQALSRICVSRSRARAKGDNAVERFTEEAKALIIKHRQSQLKRAEEVPQCIGNRSGRRTKSPSRLLQSISSLVNPLRLVSNLLDSNPVNGKNENGNDSLQTQTINSEQ